MEQVVIEPHSKSGWMFLTIWMSEKEAALFHLSYLSCINTHTHTHAHGVRLRDKILVQSHSGCFLTELLLQSIVKTNGNQVFFVIIPTLWLAPRMHNILSRVCTVTFECACPLTFSAEVQQSGTFGCMSRKVCGVWAFLCPWFAGVIFQALDLPLLSCFSFFLFQGSVCV